MEVLVISIVTLALAGSSLSVLARDELRGGALVVDFKTSPRLLSCTRLVWMGFLLYAQQLSCCSYVSSLRHHDSGAGNR